MSGKLLTISIAAYNMEQYLSDALESLMDESVIDALEIFVVDDGSTDRTLEIAQQYARHYPRSVIPVHQENGGYGTTVNYSIAHANGKYFKLLDADDWFDRQGLRILIQTLRDVDVDVVVTPFYRHWADGSDELEEIQMREKISFPICEMPGLPRWLGMWTLCYRTKSLKDCAIELPAHSLYTDVIYAIEPFARMRTIYHLDVPIYYYRLGRPGQSVTRKNRTTHVAERIRLDRRACSFYMTQKREGNENLDILLSQVAFYHMVTMKYLLLCPISYRNWKQMKEHDKEIRMLSEPVYQDTVNYGRTGRLVRLLRKTCYLPYWLLLLIPGGYPNKEG